MTKQLSRAEILAAKDVTTEAVAVPEWGGSVLIKGLTGAQRDAFEESILIRGKKGSFEMNPRRMRAKLVALSVVDEQGNLLFSEEDVEALAAKSAVAIDRVFKAAQRLSGLGDDAVPEAEARLEPAQDGASTTA